jgi:FKBP-type peptidyl-prolyl cis-trans isomerase SlyD
MKKTGLFLVLALTTLAACKGGADGIENGSNVKMHYTLTVEGNKVDSSEGRDPLGYTAGSGQIIPGLDKQLLGLKVGDKKEVTVAPADGYGLVNPQLVQTVPRKNFGDRKVKVGDMVQGQANGQVFRATVKSVSADEISIDLNHPLAGKTLNFSVEIVSVEKAATS